MLISNTWADDKFGALLSVAYTKRRLIEEGPQHRALGQPAPAAAAARQARRRVETARSFHPRIPRYGVLEHEQERLGVTASLQWPPERRHVIGLDMMYADLDATRDRELPRGPVLRHRAAGKPQTVVARSAVDVDGATTWSTAVFNNVDVRSEARYDKLETKFTQFNFYGDHKFSDDFTVNFEGGRAKSEHENPIQTTITIDRTQRLHLRLPRRRPPAGDRQRLRRQRSVAVGLHQRHRGCARLEIRTASAVRRNTIDMGRTASPGR